MVEADEDMTTAKIWEDEMAADVEAARSWRELDPWACLHALWSHYGNSGNKPLWMRLEAAILDAGHGPAWTREEAP